MNQAENLENINVDGRTILTLPLGVGHSDMNCSRVEQNWERVVFLIASN